MNSGRPRTNLQVARAGLEPGTTGLRVQRADRSATLPPYFFSLNNAKLVVFAQNIKKKKKKNIRYFIYLGA